MPSLFLYTSGIFRRYFPVKLNHQKYFLRLFPYTWTLCYFFILFMVPRQIISAEKFFSPVSVSSGNSLYLPVNPMENTLYLASSLGYFKHTGFYAGYNLLPQNNEFWGSLFIPDSVGVFGISFEHTASTISDQFSSGRVQLGFGKSLTPNLLFGFFLNYQYTNLNDLKSSLGFEPSLIYRENLRISPDTVLGIHDFFIYTALRNLDLQIQNDANHVLPSLHLGLGTSFIKSKEFQSLLQIESSINTDLSEIPISIALNVQYKMIQLRGALLYNLPISNPGSGSFDFFAGAGIQQQIGDALITAQYGMSGLLTGNLEHYFAIGTVFNKVDRTPPSLKVTTEYDSFSPNDDGNQDEIIFHISPRSKNQIQDWKLEIKNQSGEIVKVFQKDQRDRSIDFPMYRIIGDLFKRSEYRDIPETIRWNGTSHSIHSIVETTTTPQSIRLPDGKYFYEMSITDTHGLKSPVERGIVDIDLSAPQIALKRDKTGENSTDQIIFSVFQTIIADRDDHYEGIFTNDANKIVKKYTWKSTTEVPGRFFWNGKNDRGSRVKDGIYSYTLFAYDKAGNHRKEVIHNIHISSKPHWLRIDTETTGFSPNGDGSSDEFQFSASSNITNIESWTVAITRTKIQNSRKFFSIYSWKGNQSNLPAKLTWNGTDSFGEKAADGVYFLTLLLTDSQGNLFQSRASKFILDTNPPVVNIIPSMSVFTPDGDGINDEIELISTATDLSPIKSYKLTLFEILKIKGKEIRVPFKIWKVENNIPYKLHVDGISENGLDMESLNKYEYELEITDIFENTLKKTRGSIFTDVLVHNNGKSLSIILNGLTFSLNNKPETYQKLARIFSEITQDYPDYRVRVEVHTGSPGDEEFNLVQSEKRALSIMRYFISLGMPENKIGFQGFGEILPLTEVQSEIGSYKNSRVEFVLIK